jgi:hypothetical protein
MLSIKPYFGIGPENELHMEQVSCPNARKITYCIWSDVRAVQGPLNQKQRDAIRRYGRSHAWCGPTACRECVAHSLPSRGIIIIERGWFKRTNTPGRSRHRCTRMEVDVLVLRLREYSLRGRR